MLRVDPSQWPELLSKELDHSLNRRDHGAFRLYGRDTGHAEPFRGTFAIVVFAVLDTSPTRHIIGPFERAFGAAQPAP